MKLKLKFGISITIMVMILVAGISLFLVISERAILNKIIKDKKASRIELSKNLAHVCRESIIGNDQLLIINQVKNIKRNNEEIIHIIYVNEKGKIMAHTEPKKIGNQDKKLMMYKLDSEIPLEIIFPDKENTWDLFLPVMMGEKKAGTITVRFSQVKLNMLIEETEQQTYTRIAGIAGVSLLLGLFGSVVLAGMMSGPIKKLSRGALSIGEGKLDTVIDIKSRDELGALAGEFNNMAKKLKELDDMKDAFVSNITHDLKSPLGAMKGYVDFLIKGRMGNINDRQRDALVRVSENAERLSNFIGDILDYAKINSGAIAIIREKINIADIIKETIGLIEPLADKKSIILEAKVPDETEELYGDRKNLERVLHNLISNAIKFTPEKGRITVSLEDKKKEFIVSVNDTGVGIPPDDINSIFDRFHQVKDHIKLVKTRGAGLGLAIVKGIVEAHEGRVWVESKLKKGSTFYFSLPKGLSGDEPAENNKKD